MENSARQQTPFGDIQIKVVVIYWKIYVYNTDLLPLKIWVTLTLTFLARSLKVKCDGIIGLPMYGFLLMVNSNIGPNFAPLLDKTLK